MLKSGENGMYYFAPIFLLFPLRVLDAQAWTEDFAIFQYFDITGPIDKVEDALSCVCLRSATEDRNDYSTAFSLISKGNFGLGKGITCFFYRL